GVLFRPCGDLARQERDGSGFRIGGGSTRARVVGAHDGRQGRRKTKAFGPEGRDFQVVLTKREEKERGGRDSARSDAFRTLETKFLRILNSRRHCKYTL